MPINALAVGSRLNDKYDIYYLRLNGPGTCAGSDISLNSFSFLIPHLTLLLPDFGRVAEWQTLRI
jgi:hypothetical protein